jgi:hypothetical protein
MIRFCALSRSPTASGTGPRLSSRQWSARAATVPTTAPAVCAGTVRSNPVAWRLADALRGFASHRMPIVDGLAVAEASLAAAEADGEPRAQAAALVSSAGLRVRQGPPPGGR